MHASRMSYIPFLMKGAAANWFKSLDEYTKTDWESFKRAFNASQLENYDVTYAQRELMMMRESSFVSWSLFVAAF